MDVGINYSGVLVAAAFNYLFGWIWFGPIFGKTWARLSGLNDMKPSAISIVGGIISALLMSYVLAHALVFASAYMKMEGVQAGLMCGFFNWLGFVAPVTVGRVIYEKKSWSLWLLDNGYWLISLLVMGVILALWRW
jgi:hypothetical protein